MEKENYLKTTSKRIVVVGAESTGKTTLVRGLAKHYQTIWVPEYARDYLEKLGAEYEYDDLLAIAKGQQASEEIKLRATEGFLFCDTNLLTISIWSLEKFNKVAPWIEDALENRRYDFYILTDVDIPWHSDPLREHPHKRGYIFDLHQTYLENKDLPYAIVSGFGEKRLQNAVNLIDSFF